MPDMYSPVFIAGPMMLVALKKNVVVAPKCSNCVAQGRLWPKRTAECFYQSLVLEPGPQKQNVTG